MRRLWVFRRSLAVVTLLAALMVCPAAASVGRAGDPERAGPIKVKKIRKDAVAVTRPTSRPTTQAVQKAASKAKTLDDCRGLHMKGNYAAAAKGYEKLIGQDALQVSAAVGMAEALSMEGKYGKALEALDSVKDAAAARADWHIARAEALRTVGRYDDALKHAVSATELRPTWAPAILIRGQLFETLGRDDEALAAYKMMEKVVELDAYRKDAAALVALGRILDRYAILTGRRASEQAQNILHNYFQEAYQKVDKKYWPANVAAGVFLLSKHRPKTAEQEFKLAEKLNKRIPLVSVGRGGAQLSGWRFEACLKYVEKALKINPKLVEAHLLKAVCLMQWRKFAQAVPVIEKALETNPNHLEALSLMAAVHVRLRQPDGAKPYIRRVEKINPRCAALPNTIGQWLAAGRQFTEAEKYYLKAIELAPKFAGPLTSLGRLYMQTGEEDKAREILEKAHEIDDFRADVVNFLNLLKRMAKFEVRETEHFIIKLDGKYDEVLLDQVADYMEEIHKEVSGDYDHEPPVKTMIEIMPTHSQFSIRLTGRGWIGTVGACTGRVIVIATPHRERSQLGLHNWATVLRHEYAHTVTLSATKNRIPHWFTEACAVWQQPDKRNYQNVQTLVGATKRGRLLAMREIDWAFIRPKRRTDRSLAYAQAQWAMEYIIETKGFKTIQKMLKGFGEGLTQAEVFEKIVGMKEKDFDKAFGAWAKKTVKQWGYNPEPPPDLAKAAKAAKDKPKDPKAHARHALALYYRGQWKAVQKAARKALELDGENTTALAVLSYALAAEKKYDEAIKIATKLEKLDHTTHFAPKVLAKCYIAKRRWAEALAALELLKQRQPLDSYSYEELAKMYVQFGRPEKALPNLIHLHRHSMRDPKYARQIAEIYRALGRDDQAMAYFNQILHINPYETSAYKAVAEIHFLAQRYDQAVAAVRHMCLLEPDSANAWTYMAKVRYFAGKKSKDRDQLIRAREAAEKALEIDPDSPAKQIIPAIEKALDALAVSLGTE